MYKNDLVGQAKLLAFLSHMSATTTVPSVGAVTSRATPTEADASRPQARETKLERAIVISNWEVALRGRYCWERVSWVGWRRCNLLWIQ